MNFKFAARRGFTMVELLVAISIVVILAMVSIAGYTSFRKSSLLTLSGDSFVLRLNELKGDASGDCVGIDFGDDVFTYKQAFSDKKKWKDELVEFSYIGCEGEYLNTKSLEVDDAVKFTKITLFDEADQELVLDSFGMRFSPPKGRLDISLNGSDYVVPYYKSVVFVISSDDEITKEIKYDFTSLNVVK